MSEYVGVDGVTVRHVEYRNYYFKHEVGDNGKPIEFISGLPLPLDERGRLDGVTFIDCEFHPCCPDVIALGAVVK